MSIILNALIKALLLWLYDIFLDIIGFVANILLSLMSTDLTYFENNVPVIKDMWVVFQALGWALLIGNLMFQAMKSMLSGIGFEAESPAILFCRTAVFSFLLLVSRPICEIGLSISSKVIKLLNIPTKIAFNAPTESYFNAFKASWVIVIIIGVMLGWQLLKLFFEIGERYAIVCLLTYFSPIAFAMGGSKATKDIFQAYIRMYASMLLMMIMNVVFLKLILSGMANMPSDILVVPWCILMVAIAKTARKIDSIISRIGLNPAITGEPLGRGGGIATAMAARMLVNSISKSRMSGAARGSSRAGRSGAASNRNRPYSGTKNNRSFASGANFQQNSVASASSSANNTANSQQNQSSAANQSQTLAVNQQSRFGGNYSANKAGNIGASTQNTTNTANTPSGSNVKFGTGTSVNKNRFGAVGTAKSATASNKQTPQNTAKNKASTSSAANKQKQPLPANKNMQGKPGALNKNVNPAFKPTVKPINLHKNAPPQNATTSVKPDNINTQNAPPASEEVEPIE